MGLLDQETQVLHSDVYSDTLPAGAALESPVAANQNLLGDLNGLRSQLRRIIDPQGLAGTADWFVDLSSVLDNFGLRQIHDKKWSFIRPLDGNNTFTLSGSAAGVVVSSAMVAGAAGIIAVGPSSAQNNAYVAATEASFTVPGTLSASTATAASAASVVMNRVEIFDPVTGDPPLDAGTQVFGLLQVQNGVADGTSIAAAASENLQISFVKIASGVITAVNLPIDTYDFRLPFQQSFYNLDPGVLMGGGLPDVIDPGAAVPRLPWRLFIAIAATAGDPLHVQTGVFTTAGATAVNSTFGSPVLPATAAQFRDDNRVVIWRNGNKQSKGPGRDVQWVSATQFSFAKKVKANDEISVESLSSF